MTSWPADPPREADGQSTVQAVQRVVVLLDQNAQLLAERNAAP